MYAILYVCVMYVCNTYAAADPGGGAPGARPPYFTQRFHRPGAPRPRPTHSVFTKSCVSIITLLSQLYLKYARGSHCGSPAARSVLSQS